MRQPEAQTLTAESVVTAWSHRLSTAMGSALSEAEVDLPALPQQQIIRVADGQAASFGALLLDRL